MLALEAECQRSPGNAEAWRLLGTVQAENDDDPQAIAALNRWVPLQGGRRWAARVCRGWSSMEINWGSEMGYGSAPGGEELVGLVGGLGRGWGVGGVAGWHGETSSREGALLCAVLRCDLCAAHCAMTCLLCLLCCCRALAADPSNLDVLLSLGVSLTNELEAGEALSLLRQWLARHPQHGAAAAAVGLPPDSSQAAVHLVRGFQV